MGSMVMNMAANMLGLDNAATPLGLKAMRELQTLNPEPERATDEQILFLVINTASVTLIPVSIFVYRAQMGAADPTDVFVPLLIATYRRDPGRPAGDRGDAAPADLGPGRPRLPRRHDAR